MKTLEDLGIKIISLGKDKSESIKNIQYSINEKIIKLDKTYIFRNEAIEMREMLFNYGMELKDDNTPSGSLLKSHLRDFIKLLDTYIATYSEDLNELQKMINYTVANYVKDKVQKNLTDKRILRYLNEWKRLKENVTDTTKLNITNINSMQKELLTMFVKRYS